MAKPFAQRNGRRWRNIDCISVVRIEYLDSCLNGKINSENARRDTNGTK